VKLVRILLRNVQIFRCLLVEATHTHTRTLVCTSLRFVRSSRGPVKASSDGNSVLCPHSVHNVPMETCQRPMRLYKRFGYWSGY